MSIKAAYIVPHPPLAIHEVGKGREEMIKATLTGFEKVAGDISAISPDTCVIISPHSTIYSNYFHISPGEKATGSMASFGAPHVKITAEYDTELIQDLCNTCSQTGFPAGCEGERDSSLDHGTMVPMHFVNKIYSEYKVIRIGLSGLPLETHYNFGKILASVCDRSDKNVVIIASGDLSHCQKKDGPYGYRPEGPLYDEMLMKVLASGNLPELLAFNDTLLEASMECGHRSFCIMAGAFDGQKLNTHILSHEATFGVGYGVCILKPGDDR